MKKFLQLKQQKCFHQSLRLLDLVTRIFLIISEAIKLPLINRIKTSKLGRRLVDIYGLFDS